MPNTDLPSRDVRIMEKVIIWLSVFLVIIFLPFSAIFCLTLVRQYERAVILRLGKLRQGPSVGPGLIIFLPCVDKIEYVDLRTAARDIPPQEVLTKDLCTIYVNAVVFYSVFDPILAVLEIEEYRRATAMLTCAILRNVLGHKTLTEILIEREALASYIREYLDAGTKSWGVWVETVEITDVQLPIEMQRSMAAEAEATREARAKVITAEGELRAAKGLKHASDIISQNRTAIQLRYLQTMNTIAVEGVSTIIFPLPMDLLAVF